MLPMPREGLFWFYQFVVWKRCANTMTPLACLCLTHRQWRTTVVMCTGMRTPRTVAASHDYNYSTIDAITQKESCLSEVGVLKPANHKRLTVRPSHINHFWTKFSSWEVWPGDNLSDSCARRWSCHLAWLTKRTRWPKGGLAGPDDSSMWNLSRCWFNGNVSVHYKGGRRAQRNSTEIPLFFLLLLRDMES